MHRLIDNVLATRADRAKARHWASYALRQYGPDAAERLRLGLAPDAGVTNKRALRIAIRQAEGRAKQQICIAVLPGVGPALAPVAD